MVIGSYVLLGGLHWRLVSMTCLEGTPTSRGVRSSLGWSDSSECVSLAARV